ncbi:hypothetical protein [Nocardia suismassiliense]|uniref:hypothetical protein n=1 Tax=Nocardia suismassiliense TaxID=2077092 RepID=UPI000D1EB25F|nr:hypothetical protein [Nocardia suismassiliense]
MNKPITTLAASIAVIAVLSGCGTQTPAQPPRPVSQCGTAGIEPATGETDVCSAESVLLTAVRTIFGYRPSEQPDQRAAFRTARDLIDPEFAQQGEPSALVWAPVGSDQWQQWRRDGIEITTLVRLTRDDHPPDTPTAAARVLSVQIRPADQPSIGFAVYARAHRTTTTAAWLLAALEVIA